MKPWGCIVLLVAMAIGLGFGFYGSRGENPGTMFAVTVGAGLLCVLAVLVFGRTLLHRGGRVSLEARLAIWVPVVAGLGFVIAWTEGLITQLVFAGVGALIGLILPSALSHRSRRSRSSSRHYSNGDDWDNGDSDWGNGGDGGGDGGGGD